MASDRSAVLLHSNEARQFFCGSCLKPPRVIDKIYQINVVNIKSDKFCPYLLEGWDRCNDRADTFVKVRCVMYGPPGPYITHGLTLLLMWLYQSSEPCIICLKHRQYIGQWPSMTKFGHKLMRPIRGAQGLWVELGHQYHTDNGGAPLRSLYSFELAHSFHD